MASNTDKYKTSNNKTSTMKNHELATKNVSNQSPSTYGIGQAIADGMNSVGSAIDTTVKTVTETVDSVFSGAIDSVFSRSTTRITPSDRINRAQRGLEPVASVISDSRYGDSTTSPLLFPSDPGKYYIMLQFAKYKRPNGFEDAKLDPIDTIVLPMPDNLIESYSVRWNAEDSGIYGEVSTNIEKTLGAIIGRDENASVFDQIKAIGQAAGISSGAAAYRTASTIFPQPFGIVEQTVGFTPNPHPTVFFKGIDLREHNFQWKLSAESKDESDALRKIIKTIKNRMLPSLVEGRGTSLSYPYVVMPILRPNEHYLYRFKWCGVKALNVTYTPDGMPAFYTSQAPVAMNINLTLQELEYFTSEKDVGLDDLSGYDKFKDYNIIKETVS